MALLLTIMLLSALPFPIPAVIEVAEWYKPRRRSPQNDRTGVSCR